MRHRATTIFVTYKEMKKKLCFFSYEHYLMSLSHDCIEILLFSSFVSSWNAFSGKLFLWIMNLQLSGGSASCRGAVAVISALLAAWPTQRTQRMNGWLWWWWYVMLWYRGMLGMRRMGFARRHLTHFAGFWFVAVRLIQIKFRNIS